LSLGLQIGGKSINAVYVIMDDATAHLLLKNRMNLGAEAKAVAGIRTAESDTTASKLRAQANVLVYSNSEGLFVGAAVKTGYLSPHEEANQLFYNSTNRMPELLFSDWVTPPEEARFLMNYVTRLTQ
jgi:lipid-binding SYLF domain-containing protein